MIGLVKVGRTGGLFGELFTRPLYDTCDPFEVDGVTVKPPYRTDLVSAPWWARPVLPLKKMRRAAIRHDWRRKNQPHRSTRAIDDDFRTDLLADGVSPFVAWICWRAVRTNKNR
ncbi:MAG: DUF1353 domain-containing protein [Proteobacteria bacterium]|nr:DUF1353 domain-containing protein [Pseudomonadota bacterium]